MKLFPQGYSALMIHPELLQNEPSVLLMDIGGWTVDLMRLDNNVPNAATCRSLELGMIRCIDEVKEQVRRDVGLSVTDAQVERVLAGKPCSMDEDARASSKSRAASTPSAFSQRPWKRGLTSRPSRW